MLLRLWKVYNGDLDEFEIHKRRIQEFWIKPFAIPEKDLKKIQHPTLILTSKRDTAVKPEHTKQMAALIPNSILVRVKAAEHLPTVEEPHTTNIILEEFLKYRIGEGEDKQSKKDLIDFYEEHPLIALD